MMFVENKDEDAWRKQEPRESYSTIGAMRTSDGGSFPASQF